MKHRTFRTAVAVVLTAAACTLTACASGNDDKKDASPSTSANADTQPGELQGGSDKGEKETGSAPTTPSSPALAKPSVQQLNDRLTKAFDPAVPNKEKISWIQAAEQDPYLVANLVDAAKKQDVKVEVTNVQEPQDGKVKADAKVTIGGSPVDNAFISFVSEGGEWKVDHTFACNIVKSAKIESAACQE
ncbi:MULTISPECIES: hypothetical protein [Nocardia]|uniref:Low molecular weight antigen MTB12-like C-terminal domain-containing protein n=2 Tax=Nocardia TaxID=1817 RepID=K0EW06_NOCB7|nr:MULTISPECIES: hypothetical protein [Nocardia]AFU04003.1 hypothetical protein O3I_030270 [Nocardia brasiliensis ATCC 700358]ASF06151.1 hypothetical protein CEQ30_00870 [Nocardia brasiliensis]KIA65236.1 hypothetical protein FG87_08385 [Nocardia vulneris]OCF91191.1 hypothetical protein AW168_05145 [Nocardia brasiliensis]SUB53795.1 Uncharacterised protein [Nocardia brasiliensis]